MNTFRGLLSRASRGTTLNREPLDQVTMLPDESPIGVPLGEADCPPPPGSPQAATIQRVVLWPDGGDAPVVLTASPATASPPTTLQFRLRNDSPETLWTNRYGWGLWKQSPAGEWVFICPDLVNDALTRLYAGETYEWNLSIEAGGPTDGDLLPDPSGAGDLTVSGLGAAHTHSPATASSDTTGLNPRASVASRATRSGSQRSSISMHRRSS